MPHVCILYSPQDGQMWQEYFTKLLSTSNLTRVSCSVTDSGVNLAKAFSESCVVVIILTMDLINILLDPNKIACDKLNEHQSVAVISWTSLAEDFCKVKDRFSNSSKWRELPCDGSQEQCKKVVADLAGIVDEQEKSRKVKRHKRKILEIIPDRVHKSNEKIAIIFNEEQSGTVQVKLEGGDFIDCRRHNSQTYTFKAPLHDFGVTKLTVYVDGNVIHQCPFTYQTPSLEAFRSISFLAQALGVTKDNMKELDKKLVEIYESSLPADLTLHQATNIHLMSNKAKRSDYGIPTLLHFAALYGLSDLCCSVLDTPGSLAAFHIENKDGLDPAQIADKEGFSELATFIRMFIETAAVIEVSDELYLSMTGDHLYSNKSEISEERLQAADNQEKLHVSKPKKKLPPIPNQKKQHSKSILLEQPIMEEPEEPKDTTTKRKQLPPPPPRMSRSTSDLTATGESRKVVKPSPSLSSIPKALTKESSAPETERRGSLPECPVSPADFMGMSGSGLNVKRSPGSLGSSSLDELIEIQKGVSEKEFSVDEAERLYSAWKERNRSLKMSIKDRQKGLEEMRNTYASVITQAKSRGERRSLFDRIKSTLGGRRPSKEENIYQPTIKHTTYERVTDWTHNRASTVSSSSSSSGSSRDSRMSITSQDSVYHSTDTDSDEETSVRKRRETAGTDKSMAKRISYKEHYLQQSLSMEQDGPPPIPPRGARPS